MDLPFVNVMCVHSEVPAPSWRTHADELDPAHQQLGEPGPPALRADAISISARHPCAERPTKSHVVEEASTLTKAGRPDSHSHRCVARCSRCG